MLLQLVRWVMGEVRFRAEGSYPERLMNLCIRHKIPLYLCRRCGKELSGRTTFRGGKQLPALARQAGVSLRMEPPRGLPALLRQMLGKKGAAAGIFLLFLYPLVLSRFVWFIRIHGCEQIPQSLLREYLAGAGVKPGAVASAIDTRDVERQMLLKLEQLSWIAVNLHGGTAEIRVRERAMPPEVRDTSTFTNILSARTGTIVRMDVYEGQAVVHPGDSVTEGALLVSGILEDHYGKTRAVHARARVIARTEETLAVSVPLRQTRYQLRGIRVRRRLKVGSLLLPGLPWKQPSQPYRLEAAEVPIPGLSGFFPVCIFRENYLLQQEVPFTLSFPEAQKQALSRLEEMEQAAFGDGKILRRELTAQLIAETCYLSADYLVETDIALEQEIPAGDGASGISGGEKIRIYP